jgi:hypothetical protein
LRNNPYDSIFVGPRRQPGKYSLLMYLGKALIACHIKKQRYPSIDLVNILPARPAASRRLENKLILTNKYVFSYLDHLIRS